MSHNVLIVGAGIFGCHTAMVLKEKGIPFKIVDISNDIFTGSSSKNQNRLHQGFHYSRSYSTRHECMDGYMKFIRKYPFAAREVSNNYYFVDKKSLVDFKTYVHIFKYENIPFTEIEDPILPFQYNKNMFEGNAILTSERFVDFSKLQSFFKEELSEYLIKDYIPNKLSIDVHTNSIVYDNIQFTHLFDCTYYQLDIPESPPIDIFYELCIAFLYKQRQTQKSFAMTVMDGPYWSLYPYNPDKAIYSLTDVEKTPIIKSTNIQDIYQFRNELSTEYISNLRNVFENRVTKYLPNFLKDFDYHDYYISIKTKPNAKSDDRSLIHVPVTDKIHRFCGGKLTGIFPLEDIINNLFPLHLSVTNL